MIAVFDNYPWLYLHFLDRELLTAWGHYEHISQRRIDSDWLIALLSIDEPAYISASVLFESDYAFSIFGRYAELFSHPEIIRIAAPAPSLHDLVGGKREAYQRFKQRYARYYSDDWKSMEDSAPTLILKRTNTTEFLHGDIASRAGARRPSNRDDIIEVNKILPEVISRLSRASCPVTRDYVAAFASQNVNSPPLLDEVARQISYSYVETYVRDYEGTIATGLSCGLTDFDDLSRTPITHCLAVWRDLYVELGIYPGCLHWSAEDLLRTRENRPYRHLVKTCRNWLQLEMGNSSAPRADSALPWRFIRKVRDELRSIAVDRCERFDSACERTLESAAQVIERLVESHKSSKTFVVSAQLSVRLDVGTGTLRFNDKRYLQLNPGQVAVLSHLVSAAISLRHSGVAGQLSDAEVSALYTGDITLSKQEARENCYQFARQLRRQLKAIGVGDHDAVIRRMHGGGIALGSMWAKKLRKGNSEVGLVSWNNRASSARADKEDEDGFA